MLLSEDGLQASVSTVGRIITYLRQRGKIPSIHYQKRWKRKRNYKRPHANRKPKGYQVVEPGAIVQIDTLNIHPFPEIHFKHMTTRDVVEIYDKASSKQARDFLFQLIKRAPFPIKAIQVDGGSEFMADVERACRTYLEFYAYCEEDNDLQIIGKELRKWEWVYNYIRPHRALDNLTPFQLSKISSGCPHS